MRARAQTPESTSSSQIDQIGALAFFPLFFYCKSKKTTESKNGPTPAFTNGIAYLIEDQFHRSKAQVACLVSLIAFHYHLVSLESHPKAHFFCT